MLRRAAAVTACLCATLHLAPSAFAQEDDYDPEAIVSTIKSSYAKQIFACYHTALRRDSNLAGRIEISLTITKDGRVKEVTATGFDTKVDECIVKDAKGWKFTARVKEVTVPVPISLKPPAAVAAPPEVDAKVDATLKKHYLEAMDLKCMKKAPKKKVKKGKPPPKPKTKMVELAFTLRMDGTVRDVVAKGLDKKGNKCVVTQGKDWAFPEAAGDAFYSVTHSVELTSR